MRTELFWINGPWTGRLAIMPRPRGGDWLEEEIRSWRQTGIDVVVSLLIAAERTEFDLGDEAAVCQANSIEFVSFPIADRAAPTSMAAFAELVAKLGEELAVGKNVAVHCRQGIGRAALVAICLLVSAGFDRTVAIGQVSLARGCVVPETPDQKRWIADFAASMTGHGLPNT